MIKRIFRHLKPSRQYVPIAALLCFVFSSNVASSVDIRDVWTSTEHASAVTTIVRPGVGFSFKFDGKRVGPRLTEDWVPADSESNGALSLAHGSGLLVTRRVRNLPKFGAVEYKITFENTSDKVLPSVSEIKALDLSFDNSSTDSICIVSSGGGLTDTFLPPNSFAIRRQCLTSITEYGSLFELTTEGGRSSNKDMPFFFVENESRKEGLFVALGWSGQWHASVFKPPAGDQTEIRGTVPDLDIALEPGEEIAGPTVLVGRYRGSVAEGSNQLRRLIRDVYAPKLKGRAFPPSAVYVHYWNIHGNFDEPLLKELVDGAASIDQEYFLLDAGWFEGEGPTSNEEIPGWATGIGNWDRVDKAKLPNGIKPIADYARLKGLQFGLWFEPEHVVQGTTLARQHPDWILWGRTPESEMAFNSVLNFRHGLLNYGRPDVQRWVQNMLDGYIRELNIKYLKLDFNLDPLPYWDANDRPSRRGVSQLAHIQGLYAVLDWIIARHPDVMVEGCASGGRRIDLEMARRSHAFSISDFNLDPATARFHLFGINHFLPGHYSHAAYSLPTDSHKNFQADDLGFQSYFAGAFGTGGRVHLWPDAMKQQARLHISVWKKIRRYLDEDFYPLGQQPADMTSWSGWQFQDPTDKSGFIQTFRTGTADAKHRYRLQNLDRSTRYRFTDAYSGDAFEVSGATAMTIGVEITQAPMSSRVLMYRRVVDTLGTQN